MPRPALSGLFCVTVGCRRSGCRFYTNLVIQLRHAITAAHDRCVAITIDDESTTTTDDLLRCRHNAGESDGGLVLLQFIPFRLGNEKLVVFVFEVKFHAFFR